MSRAWPTGGSQAGGRVGGAATPPPGWPPPAGRRPPSRPSPTPAPSAPPAAWGNLEPLVPPPPAFHSSHLYSAFAGLHLNYPPSSWRPAGQKLLLPCWASAGRHSHCPPSCRELRCTAAGPDCAPPFILLLPCLLMSGELPPPALRIYLSRRAEFPRILGRSAVIHCSIKKTNPLNNNFEINFFIDHIQTRNPKFFGFVLDPEFKSPDDFTNSEKNVAYT